MKVFYTEKTFWRSFRQRRPLEKVLDREDLLKVFYTEKIFGKVFNTEKTFGKVFYAKEVFGRFFASIQIGPSKGLLYREDRLKVFCTEKTLYMVFYTEKTFYRSSTEDILQVCHREDLYRSSTQKKIVQVF